MKKEERKEVTGRTPCDLVIGVLQQISWSFILRILCLALIVILVLMVCKKIEIFNNRVEYVLVPANQLWIGSGIMLKPGQEIQLTVSGTVILAVHRLVEAAEKDVYPPFSWIGPEGREFDKTKPLYMKRRKLLIDPEVKPGSLFMYAYTENISTSNARVPGKLYPRPKPIIVVSKGLNKYKNDTEFNQQLFFTINEKVMEDSERAREAFIGTQEEIDKTYGPQRFTVKERSVIYDRIVREHYWDLWFDDNIGQFLVKIKFINRWSWLWCD